MSKLLFGDDYEAQEKYVCEQLDKQMKQSKAECGSKCYYRKGELKCALGHLIPDEEYNPTFENICTRSVLLNLDVNDPWLEDKYISLQSVHDCHWNPEVETFTQALERVKLWGTK